MEEGKWEKGRRVKGKRLGKKGERGKGRGREEGGGEVNAEIIRILKKQ